MASLDAGPGTHELTLKLQRASSLRVTFREGDALLSTWEVPRVDLIPLEGQSVRQSSGSTPGARFFQQACGAYRLEVVAPEFEPVPATTVRIAEGVVTEHVIELVRRL